MLLEGEKDRERQLNRKKVKQRDRKTERVIEIGNRESEIERKRVSDS